MLQFFKNKNQTKLLELVLPPQFRQFSVSEGELFVRGALPCDAQLLASRLEGQKDLAEIKGNFAAILQSRQHGTIAMVDHLSNFPLYYSEKKLTSIFADIVSESNQFNVKGDEQITLLSGHTVGSETNWHGITRLPPGYIVFRGQQKKYLGIAETPYTHEEDTTHFKNTLERVFQENVAEHNILIMSAGRDSVTMAAILKKLNLLEKFEIIHIYSELQAKSEIRFVREIAKEMDLKVHFYRQDLVVGTSEQDRIRQSCFWRDNAFLLKKLAVGSFVKPGTRIWHGEIGDQLFGGPKDGIFLRCLNQLPHFDLESMANLWITQANSNGSFLGTDLSPEIKYLFDGHYPRRLEPALKAFDEAKAEIKKVLLSVPSDYWIERWMRVNLAIKGPFRIWGYSQCELDWFTPFAHRDVIDAALPLSVYKKLGAEGKIRWIFYDLWKDYVSSIPWEKTKSGIAIPKPKKFR